MKPSKAYLLREMKDYLATVPDAAKQEHANLNVWVQQGNSPYSNPFQIADEQGKELPFIHALRAEKWLDAETWSEFTKETDSKQ